MGSLLLSYIDVRHSNFLPPNLTVGEAWDLGPRLVRADSLVPVRDESADSIFQGRVVHVPVEENHIEVQLADQAEVESVNSSEVEAEQAEGEMVIRRTMVVDQFLPGGHPTVKQQQTQGRDQPPLAARTQKRLRTTDQPLIRPEETPLRTPPASTPAVVVTQESTNGFAQPGRLGPMWRLLSPFRLQDGTQSSGSKTSLFW